MSDERISEERLVEIIRHSNCDEEECWSELAKKPEVPLMARELLALRASHAELVTALASLIDLFRDPSPFYIKKLGSPITNGDQDKIDDAFIASKDAALEAAKKVGA